MLADKAFSHPLTKMTKDNKVVYKLNTKGMVKVEDFMAKVGGRIITPRDDKDRVWQYNSKLFLSCKLDQLF